MICICPCFTPQIHWNCGWNQEAENRHDKHIVPAKIMITAFHIFHMSLNYRIKQFISKPTKRLPIYNVSTDTVQGSEVIYRTGYIFMLCTQAVVMVTHSAMLWGCHLSV
jgi:hypothetical protein